MIDGIRVKLQILSCLFLLFGLLTPAQEHSQAVRLSQPEFISLARRCASTVPSDTLLAIAQTESGLYTNAISINRPRASAKRAGYGDGQLILSRQPRSRAEATRWLRWLALHHFTVSI